MKATSRDLLPIKQNMVYVYYISSYTLIKQYQMLYYIKYNLLKGQ